MILANLCAECGNHKRDHPSRQCPKYRPLNQSTIDRMNRHVDIAGRHLVSVSVIEDDSGIIRFRINDATAPRDKIVEWLTMALDNLTTKS